MIDLSDVSSYKPSVVSVVSVA